MYNSYNLNKRSKEMSNRFIIQNVNDESLVWSNTHGWIVEEEDDNYDVFSIEESEELNLPIEGKWVRI
jgi:hypothetical protein